MNYIHQAVTTDGRVYPLTNSEPCGWQPGGGIHIQSCAPANGGVVSPTVIYPGSQQGFLPQGPLARVGIGALGSQLPGVLGDVADAFCRYFPTVCNIATPGARFPTESPNTPAPLPAGLPQLVQGTCPPGYHLNKTTYMTRQGIVPQGTRCVRNRRMNPTNPRALARAIRRGDAFVRLAKSFGMKPPERGLKRSRCRR